MLMNLKKDNNLSFILFLPPIYVSILYYIKIYFNHFYQQVILFGPQMELINLLLFVLILFLTSKQFIVYKNYDCAALSSILFLCIILPQIDSRIYLIYELYLKGFYIAILMILSCFCLSKKNKNIPPCLLFTFFFIPFLYDIFSSYMSGLTLDWYHSRPSRLNLFPISIFWVENEKPFFDVLVLSGFFIYLLILSFAMKNQKNRNIEKMVFHKWTILLIIIIASGFHMIYSKKILAYNDNIQGYTSMHLGELNSAEKYFQKVLSYFPTYQKTILNMGAVFMHKKKYAKARQYFHNALKNDPDNETAHLQLGRIYLNEKKIKMALMHLKKVLVIHPNSIQANENLGYLYFDQNKNSEALKHFQSVVDLDPTNIKGLYNLAITLSHFGQSDDSINLLSDALLINPLYVEAHDNIGVAYVNNGNIDKAVMHFRKALQINPSYQPAQKHFESLTKRIFDLARSCEMNHKLDKAISLYQKLSGFRPEWSGSLYYNISRIFSQKKDIEAAIYWLKKAVAHHFCSWDVLKSEKHFETIRNHPYYLGLTRKKE